MTKDGLDVSSISIAVSETLFCPFPCLLLLTFPWYILLLLLLLNSVGISSLLILGIHITCLSSLKADVCRPIDTGLYHYWSCLIVLGLLMLYSYFLWMKITCAWPLLQDSFHCRDLLALVQFSLFLASTRKSFFFFARIFSSSFYDTIA